MRPALIAFDVNETLLDVGALGPVFEEAVGPDITAGEWFARLLHRSVVANHLGRYQTFGEIGAEVLEWMAVRAGIGLAPGVADGVAAGMRSLPPHPDVVEGLERLAAAGHRLVALTNGARETVAAQVTNAGLAQFFERTMSVDSVQRFKPAPEVYLYAAAVCGVEIDEMLLVAAHDWDVAGAQSVGAKGCFVTRQPWGMSSVVPTMTVATITDLAAALAEESEPGSSG